jgi:hypothetical protein
MAGAARIGDLSEIHAGQRGDVRLMAQKGWKQAFDDPIPLPSGRQLLTLQAAGNYITKLPKAEYMAPEWQTATETLLLAAAGRGPIMHARVAILQAIHRNEARVFNPDQKDPHWGKRDE